MGQLLFFWFSMYCLVERTTRKAVEDDVTEDSHANPRDQGVGAEHDGVRARPRVDGIASPEKPEHHGDNKDDAQDHSITRQ